MLDLLQIEGAHALAQSRAQAQEQQQQPPASSSMPTHVDHDSPSALPPTVDMDSHPTTADAKFPPFRRASLHFLGVLVRAYTRRAYDSSSSGISGEFPVRRATVTLGYVVATDADPVVRVMAREVVEAVDTLDRALVGL